MIPHPDRQKGGAPLLGARLPGEPGPFGRRPDPASTRTTTPTSSRTPQTSVRTTDGSARVNPTPANDTTT